MSEGDSKGSTGEGEIETVVVWLRRGGKAFRGHPKPDGLRGDPLWRMEVPASAEAWIRERSERFPESDVSIRVFVGAPPDAELPKREQAAYWARHEVKAPTSTLAEDEDAAAAIMKLPKGADPGGLLQAQLVSLHAQISERKALLQSQEAAFNERLIGLREEIREKKDELKKVKADTDAGIAKQDKRLEDHTEFVDRMVTKGRDLVAAEATNTMTTAKVLGEIRTSSLMAGLNRRSFLSDARDFIREPNALPIIEDLSAGVLAATLRGCGFTPDKTQQTLHAARQFGMRQAYARAVGDVLEVVERIAGEETAKQVLEAIQAEGQRESA